MTGKGLMEVTTEVTKPMDNEITKYTEALEARYGEDKLVLVIQKKSWLLIVLNIDHSQLDFADPNPREMIKKVNLRLKLMTLETYKHKREIGFPFILDILTSQESIILKQAPGLDEKLLKPENDYDRSPLTKAFRKSVCEKHKQYRAFREKYAPIFEEDQRIFQTLIMQIILTGWLLNENGRISKEKLAAAADLSKLHNLLGHSEQDKLLRQLLNQIETTNQRPNTSMALLDHLKKQFSDIYNEEDGKHE